MRVKKIVSVMIVLALLTTSLAACGSEATGKAANSTAATAGSAAAAAGSTVSTAEEDPYKNYVKFSWAGPNVGNNGNDDIYAAIRNKFNVDIEFIPLVVDNTWMEKVRMWAASKQLPDVVSIDFTPALYPDYQSFVKAGLLKALPSLQGKYENMAAIVKNLNPKLIEKLRISGEQYLWPAYRGMVEGDKNIEMSGMFYRKDWAEKLGIDKPEFTTEDFKSMLKQFIEKDPGGNGAGKTAGMLGISYAFPDHMGMHLFSPYYDRITKADGKYVFGATLTETVEGLKFLRELYEDGLLYQDFFTQKGKDAKNMYCAGRAGVYVDSVSPEKVDDMRKNFKAANPDLDAAKAVAPLRIRSMTGTYWGVEGTGFWTGAIYNASMDDEKFERILALTDWMCSKEGCYTTKYGIKGKDWDIDASGKLTLNWPKDENGIPKRPANLGSETSVVNYYQMAITSYKTELIDNVSLDPQAVKDSLDWLAWRNSKTIVPRSIDYDEQYLISDAKTKLASPLKTAVRDEVKKIVLSIPLKDVEASWKAFLEVNKDKIAELEKDTNGKLLGGK
jgi:ABC-type glycerol-3-phosphate transport system substrate-binding protein